MTTRDRGIIARLKSSIPTTRARAMRYAHQIFLSTIEQSITKEVMDGTINALTERSMAEGSDRLWWKAQTVRWETIWRMLNETRTELHRVEAVKRISDAAFTLHEQLTVVSITELCEVPTATIKEEALRWRSVAALISCLHSHYLLHQPHISPEGKNAPNSGIIDMKE